MRSLLNKGLLSSLLIFVSFAQVNYLCAQDSPSESNKKFLIFLLMGQSNMVGARSVDGSMDTETDPRILKFNSWGSWEVASDPIANNFKRAIGPGFEFAKKMIEEDSEIVVGLVPLAVGGTNISYWSYPSYRYLLAVETAVQARHVGEAGGEIAGVLWHQGEHDSFTGADAYSYENDLKALIDKLRIDLNDPYLPFIVGGLTDSEEMLRDAPLRKVVGASIKKVGTSFFRTNYVSSVGASFMTNDPIHFNTEGQREMGRRYAEAYMTTSGHWTEKGKTWLDEGVTEEEDGWKYNPELGAYYDEFFPIINHKQLGWLKVSIDSDSTIHLDSPFIGKYRVMKGNTVEDAIYIQTEDLTDPEAPVLGTAIYVSLLSEPGDEFAFYDHSVEAYIDRLPGMTVIEDSWDLNSMVEAEYYETQLAAQLLRNEVAADEKYWSQMRRYVDDVVYHRNYTNYIGWEGYHYSEENETGNLKTFWMDKFYERLYYIDDYVRQAQTDFQDATNVLLSQ